MALLAVASENTAVAAVYVPSTTYYLSLHTATPGQNGANEVTNTGGSTYARQALIFGTATNGQEVSTDSQTFTNMPASASGFTYFGVWTAASGGTYIGGGTTTGLTGSLPAGISINMATGAVTVSFS